MQSQFIAHSKESELSEPVRRLTEDGYYIFKHIFTQDQVEALRTCLKQHFVANGTMKYGGKYQLRGLHRLPEVANIIISDGLLHVLSACTYPEVPVLTGECDLLIDTLSQWHKDIDDQGELKDIVYSRTDWHVYKAAIYLQDQSGTSREALKVRPRSHQKRIGAVAHIETLDMHAGDVAVFDVRLDHAGQFYSFGQTILRKSLTAVGRVLRRNHDQWFAALRLRFKVLQAPSAERMGVFLTFGRPNASTYVYEKAGRRNHGPVLNELNGPAAKTLARWKINAGPFNT